MMDTEQAIKTLEDLRRNDPVIQRGRNAELTKAWDAFLSSCPDRITFVKHTAGLLITPEMLYAWIEKPIWERDGTKAVEEAAVVLENQEAKEIAAALAKDVGDSIKELAHENLEGTPRAPSKKGGGKHGTR